MVFTGTMASFALDIGKLGTIDFRHKTAGYVEAEDVAANTSWIFRFVFGF